MKIQKHTVMALIYLYCFGTLFFSIITSTEVTIKLVKIGKGISSVENHLLNDKHGLTKHRINYTKQLVIAFPRSQSSQFLSQPHTINNLNPKTHEEIKHEKVRWVTVEKTSVQT